MRVLVVRLTSMGDVIQTMPALVDAATHIPDIKFDWVVDESFAEIPAWHQQVDRVIVCHNRRWRKQPQTLFTTHSLWQFVRRLRARRYDYVIDVQTALKSALVSRLARGVRCGYVKAAVFERGAELAYQRKYLVAKGQNSLVRMRQLMAQALGYEVDAEALPAYGIDRRCLSTPIVAIHQPYLVFVHSASWPTKGWLENHWQALIDLATQAGFTIVLPWGSVAEQARSKQLAQNNARVVVLPSCDLTAKASVIAGAEALVGVDTGLTHLAAALEVPAVGLYGPTDPILCGTRGSQQIHLQADYACLRCHRRECQLAHSLNEEPPCFQALSPTLVWEKLQALLSAEVRV